MYFIFSFQSRFLFVAAHLVLVSVWKLQLSQFQHRLDTWKPRTWKSWLLPKRHLFWRPGRFDKLMRAGCPPLNYMSWEVTITTKNTGVHKYNSLAMQIYRSICGAGFETSEFKVSICAVSTAINVTDGSTIRYIQPRRLMGWWDCRGWESCWRTLRWDRLSSLSKLLAAATSHLPRVDRRWSSNVLLQRPQNVLLQRPDHDSFGRCNFSIWRYDGSQNPPT